MKTYNYVDNSNVFIEGQRVSAVTKGLSKNIYDAMNNNILDHSWNVDYGKLHLFLCGKIPAKSAPQDYGDHHHLVTHFGKWSNEKVSTLRFLKRASPEKKRRSTWQ